MRVRCVTCFATKLHTHYALLPAESIWVPSYMLKSYNPPKRSPMFAQAQLRRHLLPYHRVIRMRTESQGGASKSNTSNNIILPFNVSAWLMKLREIWNPHVSNHSRSQHEAAPRGIMTRQPSLIVEDFPWHRLGQKNAAPYGLAATHMHVLIGYEMQ